MPIKWSALRVNEAMDMVEEFINQAVEPLEQAKVVTSEARNIANLPQYLDQRLVRLIIDIERIDYIRNSIRAVPFFFCSSISAISASRNSPIRLIWLT